MKKRLLFENMVGRSQSMQQQEYILKIHNNQAKVSLPSQLQVVETLNKALQISLDEYYFVLFQAFENMMSLAYTLRFLALGDVGLHG